MPFSVRGWSAHWLLLLALSPLGLAVLAAGPLLCRADNPTALDPGKKIPEVTVETTGPDSFQATWKAILWAARYEVSFGTNPAASNRGTQFIATTAFSRGNLIAATTYYIKVRAIIGGRADAWSEVVAVTTQLPPITGLAVDDVSDTGMHLTWPGLYTGMADVFYEISLETNPAATARELQTTQQNTLSLSQLRPHTTYYLKIRLRRNLVTGPWSDPMPVATLTATSGPMVLAESEKAPLNLLEVTHTSVKAGWAEIPGAEAYELAYLPLTAPENQKPLSLKTHRPPVDLANLKPGLAYRVKLRPLFPTRGPGAWSSFLTFSTFPAPPAPNPLYLVQVTDTYVQLTWTAQEGIGTYEALVSTDALDEDGNRQIVHLGAARLEGLMENTRYWAKVRALSQGGPGVWSAPVTFISPLISAPKNLTPLHVTATESAVNWTRVPGNATTTYELRLAAEGEAWRTFTGLTAHNRSLNDLSPDTRYHVQVRAKNTTGYGPWSPETTLHTPI
ncbi:MAG: fibronectin type III domain-containing protein, partial [Candidatus Firestonebacteria bacterium]|nr:fibronectin type III domain-containing protein [Candidatus Firestonebacteria bacterium]